MCSAFGKSREALYAVHFNGSNFSKSWVGGGLIGYVKSKPLRNGQIISIDVLVVVMIIALFHEKLI